MAAKKDYVQRGIVGKETVPPACLMARNYYKVFKMLGIARNRFLYLLLRLLKQVIQPI